MPKTRTLFCGIAGIAFSAGLGIGALLGARGEATGLEAPEAIGNLDADSRREVIDLVTRSLRSWQATDRDEFLSTAHPDLVFAFPGRRTDREGALRIFDTWRNDYEDTKVYINRILVDGNEFAAEYQFATTRRDNGKRSVAGTFVYGRVESGQIAVLKEYLDARVSRGQEAGLMPLDEGAEPFPWPPIDMSEVDLERPE